MNIPEQAAAFFSKCSILNSTEKHFYMSIVATKSVQKMAPTDISQIAFQKTPTCMRCHELIERCNLSQRLAYYMQINKLLYCPESETTLLSHLIHTIQILINYPKTNAMGWKFQNPDYPFCIRIVHETLISLTKIPPYFYKGVCNLQSIPRTCTSLYQQGHPWIHKVYFLLHILASSLTAKARLYIKVCVSQARGISNNLNREHSHRKFLKSRCVLQELGLQKKPRQSSGSVLRQQQ